MSSLSETLTIRLLILSHGLRQRVSTVGKRLFSTRRRRVAGVAAAIGCAVVVGFLTRSNDATSEDPQSAAQHAEVEFGGLPPVVIVSPHEHGGRMQAASRRTDEWQSSAPVASARYLDGLEFEPAFGAGSVRGAVYERPATASGGAWLTGTIEDPADRRERGN